MSVLSVHAPAPFSFSATIHTLVSEPVASFLVLQKCWLPALLVNAGMVPFLFLASHLFPLSVEFHCSVEKVGVL